MINEAHARLERLPNLTAGFRAFRSLRNTGGFRAFRSLRNTGGFRAFRSLRNTTYPLLCCLVLGGTIGNATAQLPLKPFSARYVVHFKGIEVGTGSIVLNANGAGRYGMQATVEPKGLLALFTSYQLDESVEGVFADGVPLPQVYRGEQTGGSREHRTTAHFDWAAGKLAVSYNDRRNDLLLTARVVDPLSLYALAMNDLKQGRQINKYTLLNRGKLITYQVNHGGHEQLSTKLGPLDTLRVSRQKSGGSRKTTLWFAPALDYLPIQVVQDKKGKEQFRMTLESVER